METTIPFSGFYNSIHDSELDNALESIFSDSHGNPIASLRDRAFGLVDWKEVHLDYAKKYTECFADETSLESLKFKLLCSPKYYNFETDRIICHIDLIEVQRMKDCVPTADLEARIKRRFTSCDGFISHYPNSLAFWPPQIEDWDHNQVGTLLEVFTEQQLGEFDSFKEYSLMGDTYEHAYHIVASNIKDGTRLFKIADYLRTREERQYV